MCRKLFCTKMKSMTKIFTGAFAALLLAAPAAQAQTTFTGSTGGCFTACAAPGLPSAVFQGLTFTSGSFTGQTDVNGLLPIGGTGNNFGTLSLTHPPTFNYNGTSFRLFVTFTAPTPSSGPTQYNAALTGNVQNTGNGVFFSFDPSAAIVNFAGNVVATLTLNNLSVNAGDPAAAITGVIRQQVPEPSSVLLLTSGLAAFAFVGYRRRV